MNCLFDFVFRLLIATVQKHNWFVYIDFESLNLAELNSFKNVYFSGFLGLFLVQDFHLQVEVIFFFSNLDAFNLFFLSDCFGQTAK